MVKGHSAHFAPRSDNTRTAFTADIEFSFMYHFTFCTLVIEQEQLFSKFILTARSSEASEGYVFSLSVNKGGRYPEFCMFRISGVLGGSGPQYFLGGGGGNGECRNVVLQSRILFQECF